MQFPDSGGEGRVGGAGKEYVELGQVVDVGVAGCEEVVGWERLVLQGALVCCESPQGAGVLRIVRSSGVLRWTIAIP